MQSENQGADHPLLLFLGLEFARKLVMLRGVVLVVLHKSNLWYLTGKSTSGESYDPSQCVAGSYQEQRRTRTNLLVAIQ